MWTPIQIHPLVHGVADLAKYQSGEEVLVDVNCDSEFMMEFHGVPFDVEIMLVMDNACGHDTRDTIDEICGPCKALGLAGHLPGRNDGQSQLVLSSVGQ